MKSNKRSPDLVKILKAMDKVHDKLIEYKKKNNGLLVVMKDNKIVLIKP